MVVGCSMWPPSDCSLGHVMLPWKARDSVFKVRHSTCESTSLWVTDSLSSQVTTCFRKILDCCGTNRRFYWDLEMQFVTTGSSAPAGAAAVALGEAPFLAASGVLEASFVKCASGSR